MQTFHFKIYLVVMITIYFGFPFQEVLGDKYFGNFGINAQAAIQLLSGFFLYVVVLYIVHLGSFLFMKKPSNDEIEPEK